MSTWIFQGNPKYFNIDAYLNATDDILWEVMTTFVNTVAIGDRVFMWRSDAGKPGSGGVIARGTITAAPMMLTDEDAVEFYNPRNQADAHIDDWRVAIHIDSKRLVPPILTRIQASDHPRLSTLLILRFAEKGNFLLDVDQAAHLEQLYCREMGLQA
jgi:5-methylcytosine-specific restriction protein A